RGSIPRKGIWSYLEEHRPRCEPQSNQTSEPAPFAPDTGAPTINIRRWGSMPGKGSGFTCRRTALGANRNRTQPQPQPDPHPTRPLLQSACGGEGQYPEWDLAYL